MCHILVLTVLHVPSSLDSGPTTRWSTRVSLTPDTGVIRDQICTTRRLKVNCFRQVDFGWKGRSPPCGTLVLKSGTQRPDVCDGVGPGEVLQHLLLERWENVEPNGQRMRADGRRRPTAGVVQRTPDGLHARLPRSIHTRRSCGLNPNPYPTP